MAVNRHTSEALRHYPELRAAERGPARRPLLGGVLMVVSVLWLLSFPGWCVDKAIWGASFTAYSPTFGEYLGYGAALLFFAAGVVGFTFARKLMAADWQKLLAMDRRPPILYLRTFADDGRIWHIGDWESRVISSVKGGPALAIGRPGELFRSLGAARIYVADAHWRRVIGSLLLRSKLVVMRIGSSPGLAWELDQCFSLLAPEQLLIQLPSFSLTVRRDRAYESFRRAVSSDPQQKLPPRVGNARFLWFRENWRPVLLGAHQDEATWKQSLRRLAGNDRPNTDVLLKPVLTALDLNGRVRWYHRLFRALTR